MRAKNNPSRLLPLALLPLATLAGGCINDDDDSGGSGAPTNDISNFDATVATEWSEAVLAAIDAENLNPPEASRRIGYAFVALYEAVVQGSSGQLSLGRQLNGLDELPAAPTNILVHWPSAANAAMARVLADLFATAQPTTLQIFTDKETELATQFAIDEPNQANRDGAITFGQSIGDAIIAWADEDGYATWDNCAYTPPVGDGLWVPTPPANAAALEPCWGNLRPFVLLFGAECAPLSHPTFSRTAGSAFEVEGREVYDTVNNLTAEQQEIATFWADGGGTITPPGHWISITSIVLTQEDLALDVAAEAFVKVGIGVADAFISCWEIKFAYNLLRPITYIRDPLGPINDPAWVSFIGTPPFPEFTSGHSTQSGTAALLLEDLLGDVTFTDTTHAALPPRTFDSFGEAATEAAISRIYGGIHYRSAIERGLEQGQCIATVILRNVDFRP